MLSSIDLMITKAYQQKYAIPHFNINNLEWAKNILEACEEMSSPVILGASESAIKYMGGYNVVAALVKSLIIDLEISVPVGLLLDHGSSYESCEKAINAGFNGVMISPPEGNIENNLELINRVNKLIGDRDIYLEAEIGSVLEVDPSNKIKDAIYLAQNSNIDALAPWLGSKHGLYDGEVKLDFASMQTITENTKIPLVLHGGSGIPDHMTIKAIEVGVAKININTDFQLAWSKSVRTQLNQNIKVYDPRTIIGSGREAMFEIAKTKILLFGSNYKA